MLPRPRRGRSGGACNRTADFARTGPPPTHCNCELDDSPLPVPHRTDCHSRWSSAGKPPAAAPDLHGTATPPPISGLTHQDTTSLLHTSTMPKYGASHLQTIHHPPQRRGLSKSISIIPQHSILLNQLGLSQPSLNQRPTPLTSSKKRAACTSRGSTRLQATNPYPHPSQL